MVIALVLLAASVAVASAAPQHHIFSEKQAKFLAIGPALDSGAHDGTIAWNDEETGAIINKPQPWSDAEDDRPPMLHRASSASTLTILPVVLLPFVFDLLTLSVPQHFSIDSTRCWMAADIQARRNSAQNGPAVRLIFA